MSRPLREHGSNKVHCCETRENCLGMAHEKGKGLESQGNMGGAGEDLGSEKNLPGFHEKSRR